MIECSFMCVNQCLVLSSLFIVYSIYCSNAISLSSYAIVNSSIVRKTCLYYGDVDGAFTN